MEIINICEIFLINLKKKQSLCTLWQQWLFDFLSSVQSLSRVQLFVTPWTAAHQAYRPSPTPGVCSKSCPSSWWCHPTISSSVVPFSSCLQSFPSIRVFSNDQFFALGGKSIGVSASASVLPMNIQDWFSLGWTALISLQSKGLSESSPMPQFKSIKFSVLSFLCFLYGPTHIYTWLLEKL